MPEKREVQVTEQLKLVQISPYIWEVPPFGEMRVPGRIYGDEGTVEHLVNDVKAGKEWNALQQVINVACLPGIQKASLAMADVHPGYGFPIGGVGAFDLDKGVIAVGGIGFDINCLSGESKVLHEFGYTRPIKSFHRDFHKNRIKCLNPTSKLKDTDIHAFIRSRPKNKVYEITTKTGYKITATQDHPFFTPRGMKRLEEIEREQISVFPFEGVEYEEPFPDPIVTKKDLRAFYPKRRLHQAIEALEERGLLPLTYDNPKLPYLLKIFGFVLGDGTAYFTRKNKGVIWFYEEPENLAKIQGDIGRLGFTSSRIYQRHRKHEIDTQYGKVKFERTESSIKTTSSSLLLLLHYLGLPLRDKTRQDFVIPSWLFKCSLWQKRLFLASFFGAELSSPVTVTDHGYNFYGPVLSQNKKSEFVQSGREFLKQVKSLLDEFGIRSTIIGERDDYLNKKKELSIRLRLQISSKPENLLRFWSKVGYEYNYLKHYRGNAVVAYLRLKRQVIEQRKFADRKAKKLKQEGCSPQKIFQELSSLVVNKRFLERSLWERRKTDPRVAQNFPTFDKFLEEKTEGLGQTGQVWDEVVGKREIGFDDYVFDFTVEDKNHNFIANNFVVSNCGVRTMRTQLKKEDIEEKKNHLAEVLYRTVPAGLGSEGDLRLTEKEIDQVLVEGANFAVKRGYGTAQDLEFLEEKGCIAGADPSAVSFKAKQRQFRQVGTLGSGNHYLEVQYVEEIYSEEAAKAYGLWENQILVSFHCGSRALGHQIGTDYLQSLEAASKKYNLPIRERELVCAPISSSEGKEYFDAVKAGINCAFANRQVLAHLTRKAFEEALGVKPQEMVTFYEIGHNTAKIEKHEIDGGVKELLVHRKGATRAFGPGREELPEAYQKIGQPVLVGGTMGTCSFILHGTTKAMEGTFGSSMHGAGRIMSRRQAKKSYWGGDVLKVLAKKGIIIKAHSKPGVAEEAPGAYKDVEQVINVMHEAGISPKVARLRPLVCIKG